MFRLVWRIPTRIRNVKRLLGAVVVLLLPTLGFAHHALQSEFDINDPSHRWTGTLKSVQWMNPHSHFVIDVTDESGQGDDAGPSKPPRPTGCAASASAGRASSRSGKTYTVIGYPARDGSAIAFVEQITLPDGRTVRIWFGDPNGSN